MNFKTSWLAAAVISGATVLSGAALAADPVYEVVDTAHDWSGVYVGVHAGYGEARLDADYDSDGGFELDEAGGFGGIQAGYNWQSGNFVYGIEADITFTDWDDDRIQDGEELITVETDYMATLRARAGYAIDRTLIFGTVGAALTDTEYYVNDHIDDTDPDEFGSLDFNSVGLVAGGGVEYALNSQWSIKAEGLYFWFNDDKDAADLTHDSDEGDFAELKDAWMVRVGLNYHF